MPSVATPEAAGLLGLLVLVLLPGLLVARAPWTVMPALSVAFWVLGWWWLPIEGRSRIVMAALTAFVLLALLRLLPKHAVPPPPGYDGPRPEPAVSGPTTGTPPRLGTAPSLMVVALALVLVVPFGLWAHAPGREMAFHTTSARLAVWRDAVPASYTPLLPLGPFGAHAPALPTLAADVSLVSGLDPVRSVVAVTLLSAGLVLLGLYALLATWLRPPVAAAVAILGLAAVPWPGFLALWGEGGPLLGLALALPAAALLLGHASAPSAFAAGGLLAAAALAQPLLALVLAAATAVALVVASAAPPRGRTGHTPATPTGTVGRAADHAFVRTGRRLALAGTVALIGAAPPLVRLGRALSMREAVGVIASVRGREIADFALAVGVFALAALLARRLGGTPAEPDARDRAAAVGSRASRRAVVLVVSAFAAAGLVVRVHGGLAAGQLPLAERSALARLARRTSPVDPVCAPASVADWVPAMAARPVGEPARLWAPPALSEESQQTPRPPCVRALDRPWRPR